MNDYVFHSCFDAWFCHTVLKKMFFKKCFVRDICGKFLRLAIMVGITNAGQHDLCALSAVVVVFGDYNGLKTSTVLICG